MTIHVYDLSGPTITEEQQRELTERVTAAIDGDACSKGARGLCKTTVVGSIPTVSTNNGL